MESCDKCLHARRLRQCIIEEDQASCRPCRDSRTSCDRKMRFLYESTRDDFFPTLDEFMLVYNARDQEQLRSYKKTANKQKKAALPYTRPSRVVVLADRPPATLVHSQDSPLSVKCTELYALYDEIQYLRHRVKYLENSHQGVSHARRPT
ncbi:hypothetical protein B0H11DRAFT_2190797 [Mycena galericulata]|nr:hypothetical protein B0H11DRAFT_2190797 [Mycena galericulata]